MASNTTPKSYISGIDVPDIEVESTIGNIERAIIVDHRNIIGHMVCINPNREPNKTAKYIMQSLDKEIIMPISQHEKKRSLLMFWMAIEIRNLNRKIDILQQPRTDLGTYL